MRPGGGRAGPSTKTCSRRCCCRRQPRAACRSRAGAGALVPSGPWGRLLPVSPRPRAPELSPLFPRLRWDGQLRSLRCSRPCGPASMAGGERYGESHQGKLGEMPPLCLFGIPLGFSLRKRRENLEIPATLAFSSVGSNFWFRGLRFTALRAKGCDWQGRDVRLPPT